MKLNDKTTVLLVLAAPALAFAVPAQAAPNYADLNAAPSSLSMAFGDVTAHHHYDDDDDDDDYRDRRYRNRGYGYRDRNYRGRDYSQPVYRDTRIWRGRDGRYYCRKEDGTTGLLIGAAVGGLIGNEVAGRGDRTLGAILGAAGGAILGRAIDRSNSRCR